MVGVASIVSSVIAICTFVITAFTTYTKVIHAIPDQGKISESLTAMDKKLDKIDDRLTQQAEELQDVRERVAVLEYAIKEK